MEKAERRQKEEGRKKQHLILMRYRLDPHSSQPYKFTTTYLKKASMNLQRTLDVWKQSHPEYMSKDCLLSSSTPPPELPLRLRLSSPPRRKRKRS
jgi:hypothetical protein